MVNRHTDTQTHADTYSCATVISSATAELKKKKIERSTVNNKAQDFEEATTLLSFYLTVALQAYQGGLILVIKPSTEVRRALQP